MGGANIVAVLKKLGGLSVAQMPNSAASGQALPYNNHWMPRIWPLPFWTAESGAAP
jgi:hypothetical protein